ncbi:MAG: hypothetical protein RR898_08755 [Clostridium sp.]|uniref:hypothetical protein n=1 Tax=Clostridium sp. TaxID=1506 RepID=UPI002FC7794E
MLGKLLKYEFKATSRTFLPLYLVIILVAIFNGFLLNINMIEPSNYQMIGIIVLIALVIALGVVTIVVTVQRFYKNLLGDEGYLMFTIPVSIKSIVLSKGLVATFWAILSGIVSLLAFGIIVFMQVIKAMLVDSEIREIFAMINMSDITAAIKDSLPPEIYSSLGTSLWLIIAIILISYFSSIFTIYLAMAIGQMPKFTGYKVAASVIAYFVVSFLLSLVAEIIIPASMLEPIGDEIAIFTQLKNLMYYLTFISVIECALMFFGTTYILEKKLNLS